MLIKISPIIGLKNAIAIIAITAIIRAVSGNSGNIGTLKGRSIIGSFLRKAKNETMETM